MIYLLGTIGFFCGFLLGQAILAYLLRNRSREELLSNKALHWKYGALNWLVALLIAASAVYIYDRFFF